MTDDELDEIRARDAKRRHSIKPGLKTRNLPDFMPLYELLTAYLSKPCTNCGNIYADELTDALLSSGVVKIATKPQVDQGGQGGDQP